MGIKLNLKNVRVGWLNVFEKAADSVNQQGQPVKGKFQATIYLDKDDPQINKLDATVLEVLTEGMKSAKAAEKWMDRNYGFGNHADKCAVRDLAEREKPIEGLEEGLYLKATSHKSPRIETDIGEVQNTAGGRPLKGLTVDGDDIEGKEVYSGCYANVSVEIYWYDTYKTLMVSLLGIRFREDGPAFGGASEVATDDDLSDDDEKPAKPSRRSRSDDDEDEAPRRKLPSYEDDEAPRRKRRSYEDDEE